MKVMKEHYTVGVAVAAFAIVTGASIAFAQSAVTLDPSLSSMASASTSAITYPQQGSTPAPMVTNIDSSGSALIRGTVIGTGMRSITIAGWGGPWTIRTGMGSIVIPRGTSGNADLSGIAIGDFVGAEGSIATDTPYAVDASLIRDWTTNLYPAGITATMSASATPLSPNATGTAATSSSMNSAGQPPMNNAEASTAASSSGASSMATGTTMGSFSRFISPLGAGVLPLATTTY